MSLFDKVKKDMAALRKPQTTVIKVKEYQLNSEIPGKSAILGLDLLNKDESGNPKEVRVLLNDPDGKLMGVGKFANKNSLVHTEVGGLIRVDRFIKKGEDYVCRHMQRIAQDDTLTRMDDSNVTYKIGFDEAWVKVIPQMANGEVITYPVRNNGAIQRGTVKVIPAYAPATEVVPGNGKLLDQLKAVASRAIDAAPEKTAAMILLRAPESPEIMELVIPSVIEEAEGKYRPRTKEEMMSVLPELDIVQTLVKNEEALAGNVIEAVPGYSMKVYGSVKADNGEDIEGRVRQMARETCRMFAKPVEGQSKPEMVKGNQEYALSLISYEIPQVPRATNANLVTLGRVPAITASPNAGRDITPNKFYNNQVPAAATTDGQKADTSTAAATAAAASTVGADATGATPEAAKPAAQGPSNATATGKPEEPPMPSDEDLDMLLSQTDGVDDLDFDLDEMERQLGSTMA